MVKLDNFTKATLRKNTKVEFSIINKTRVLLPSLPVLKIKNDILGKNYSLSLGYVNKKISQEINNRYRKKNKPTNILSFALSKKEGEIILCPSIIKKETINPRKNDGENFKKYLGFLIIHGMLHLKGFDHGDKMEKLEQKYIKKHLSRTKFFIK